ncbi:MAG TPA: prolyl oligopeptidase family serine peptidase [Longimicrobiales bacterium]|nr:prolyl oligopeptidase family serine peptidase [Longimicrobiales bacterium]
MIPLSDRTTPFPPRAARHAAAALLLAATLAVPARAQDAPFTLEQVLSAPFPASLAASPAGNRVAWVFEHEGSRNIWVADAPEWRGRPLTSFAGDDGQAIGGVRFTPDGERLLFARGGAPNRQGDVPNPASAPEGVERGVWIVEVAGGEARRLTDGALPTPSPRGERAAISRGGAIYTLPLSGEGEEEKLLEVRRGAGDLTWSPDGRRLAFVSGRGDHAFVGVYDLDEARLTWMDPSVDRDGSPAWSPDGTRVAFIRTPNVRGQLPFVPRREGHPWSIHVADARTGEAREVWRADPGRGSVFHGVTGDNLIWAAGDRLVFPWERTDWTHLYSIPAGGGAPVELTAGAGEVQYVTVTPDGGEVVWSSNHGDIDRQHLWAVSVAGGTARTLTSGRGLEWSPVVPSPGTVAFLASDATTPAHPAILVEGRRRELAPGSMPADFPSRHLVEPRQVIFPAADGLPIHGQLFEPPARCGQGEKPGLLFFHGGSRRQMYLGFHDRGYYHNAYAFNQYMAARCYVVLSVNYRSGVGYGMAFREATHYGATGGSEFNDVLGAGLWMANRPDVDRDRIGLWGGSYGGYLTALGLARASDLFAAGVDVHGVHDWNAGIRNFVPSYRSEADPEFARIAFEASPMAWLDTWRSPVLLIHGDDDRNVAFTETVELVEELRARGVEHEQLVFPDEVHGFLLHRSWLRAYRAAADFLDRHLR